ncbi:hypothetical protein HK096_002737, partial [Nowakowskiella sp. JEL0078]
MKDSPNESPLASAIPVLLNDDSYSAESKRSYQDKLTAYSLKLWDSLIPSHFKPQENNICNEEKYFQKARIKVMREAFAKFIDVPIENVDERDIPIIGISGSGGGLKAAISTIGYLEAMEKHGFFDLAMYIAGVSGSCWALSYLYTVGNGLPSKALVQMKKTLNGHPGNLSHITDILSVNSSSRVPLLFSGMSHKKLSGLHRGVVDTYGILLFAHFLGKSLPMKNLDGVEVEEEDICWNPNHFKLSSQARFLENGQFPMPIYTAVRHERPWSRKFEDNPEAVEISEKELNRRQTIYEKNLDIPDGGHDSVNKDGQGWLQWWEFQPYQIGCDEVNCIVVFCLFLFKKILKSKTLKLGWIPTWSFGRKFEGGKTINEIPEQSFALQVGLTASAMCAPWTTALETVERGSDPTSTTGSLVRKILQLSASVGSVHQWISSHPIHAAYNWNPMYKLHSGPQPPGLNHAKRIQLIDADGTPPPLPPRNDSSDEEKSKFQEQRYCQVFNAKPSFTITGTKGPHGEPLATNEMSIIYFPLLPNPNLPGYTPSSVTFGKLQYEEDEVTKLSKCAGLNFETHIETVRKTVRDVWEKK